MNVPNSAARNAMTNSERTVYNWGLEDGRDSERSRLIQLIDDYQHKPDFTLENLKALIKEQK